MDWMHPRRHPALYAALVAALLLLPACSPVDQRNEPDTAAAGSEARADSDVATCAAHGAPEEQCFICDASLRDPGRLWCQEHDRYEDRCWLCHPELEDKDRLWCEEHSLYEDECFLCHPELLEKPPTGSEGAAGSETVGDLPGSLLMCNEHGLPEEECGICHPELLARNAVPGGLKVRLASPESASKAGVVVRPPDIQPMTDGVACFAEIAFDQNKLANITSLVHGVVKSVEVDLGDPVGPGQLLATITSAEIGEAQADYMRALAENALRETVLEQERSLFEQQISSERKHQEAEAAHQVSTAVVWQARQRLVVLGFDESKIEALIDQRSIPGVLEIRSPFGGEIVERGAVQGSVIDTADVLFTIADTRMLWAMVNIPESELVRVHTGQAVELTVESLPGHTFPGTLNWISATVDEQTRMARGRVEVANREGRLKARMFARARILTSRSDQAVVVPVSAVQQVSGVPIVFVQFAEDLFEARPVTLGVRHEDRVEIAEGLHLGEPVVVVGSFTLKSQLLASRLGAGCVDE